MPKTYLRKKMASLTSGAGKSRYPHVCKEVAYRVGENLGQPLSDLSD
jgi:hypothetical protein